MSVNGMGSDAPLIRSVESRNSEPGVSTTWYVHIITQASLVKLSMIFVRCYMILHEKWKIQFGKSNFKQTLHNVFCHEKITYLVILEVQ